MTEMLDRRAPPRPFFNKLLMPFLGAVTVAMCLSAIYLPAPIVDRMLRDDVHRKAQEWRLRVLDALESGSETFARATITRGDELWLSQVTTLSEIYCFKLIAAEGQIFWSTQAEDIGVVNEMPFFRRIVAAGNPPYQAEDRPVSEVDDHFLRSASSNRAELYEDETGKLMRIAEIHEPILQNGRVVGAIAFYTDLTELRAIFVDRLERIFIALSVVSLLMLVVTSTVIRRSGRMQLRVINQRAEQERQMMAEQMRLARNVRLLGELNEWLQSSRSLDELFKMVGRFMSHILPNSEGSAYVYSSSRDVLVGSASWNGGHHCDHIRAEDCWGLRRGRTYTFGSAEVDFPCSHSESQDDRPSFCFPVLAHGETVGLLHLKAKDNVPLEEFRASQRLAQMCAEQISLAIANVQMRDQLHDRSIRDPLTGLYNRRHLTETLRRQLEQAHREERPLSILSIDVDHFKRFNDTHGHDAGDMVLRAVASVFEQVCEGDETACRMGGEEFMLLLPDLGLPAAALRAEALRGAVERINVRYGEKSLPRITISVGVAVHPEDGTMPQQLMKAADDALYDAKGRGRNRVAIAGEDDPTQAEVAALHASPSPTPREEAVA